MTDMVQREKIIYPASFERSTTETVLTMSLESQFSSHRAAFILYFVPKTVKSLDILKQKKPAKYFLLKLSDFVCVMKSI